jgi:MSHA biogenesis protein MshM
MALYLEHFGLSEPPFRITPHTDFFFDGADRGATLEALVYAVLHDEGIVKVSGEVGSGKTMLCRVLMERLPAHVETLYIATPSLAHDEILHAIAAELELQLPEGRTSTVIRELQEQLIRLYAAGRRVVVLVDEAHVMPDETLEQIRLLSNLESNRHKLLQIVLFGQPELDATVAKPSLRQLRDRITHSFRMRPLSEAEVAHYLSFRMRAAGYRGPEVFSKRAVTLMTRASSGLTRRLNILADKALLSAFSENSHAIGEKQVRAAIADSEFARVRRKPRPLAYAAAALVAGLLIGAAVQGWLAPAKTEGVAAPTAPPAPVAVAAPKVEAPPVPAAASPVMAAPVTAAPALSRLLPAQQRRFDGYDAAGQKLLGERLSAARSLLDRTDERHFSIELFITEHTDPARMERFLVRARELVPLDQLYVIPMSSGGEYRLRVVFGDFATRDEAAAADKRLPPKYQAAFRTALRTFGELRGQI